MKNFLVMFFLLFSYSFSYLQVYPTIFDKNIDGIGNSQTYEFSNPTQNKVRYIFYIDKIQDKNNMSEWIEFYPKIMVLNPNESKKLTVFIKSPEKTKPGEYTAILGIKELPVIEEKDIINRNKSLNLLTNLKIEIAGFVGKLPVEIKVNKLKLNKTKKILTGFVKNESKKRLTLSFYLQNSLSKKEFYIGSGRVLSKQTYNLEKLPKIEKIDNLGGYNSLIIKYKEKEIKRINL